jgi:thioredoxin reductase (NADPH)
MHHSKVIIIGSGPAGLTAALYTARANLSPLVFEGLQPGGQLTITTEVENYPGFEHGIMGPELMNIMRKQAERFGSRNEFKIATKVDFSVHPLRIWCDEEMYTADTVIISTGASAKLLNLSSEQKFMGYGVSACATCDGFFFRNQEIAVVGGGDTALEEANYLTRFASKVSLIHRRDSLRASKVMIERAEKNPKIHFLWNTVVDDVLGSDDNGKKSVTGLRLRNVATHEFSHLVCTGLFIAIGHQPNTKLFEGQIELDSHGYILTKGKSTATNIPGVFAAGDVADPTYRQAVSAAGSGCMAAIDAERWLEHL